MGKEEAVEALIRIVSEAFRQQKISIFMQEEKEYGSE